MGLIEKKSKRKLLDVETITLDRDKALSFVCDDVILLPVGAKTCRLYKNLDAVLCRDCQPVVRLKGGGDVLFIEPSTRSFKIDVFNKSKVTRLFPTFGRLRVDWDGVDLHVTRLPDGETL